MTRLLLLLSLVVPLLGAQAYDASLFASQDFSEMDAWGQASYDLASVAGSAPPMTTFSEVDAGMSETVTAPVHSATRTYKGRGGRKQVLSDADDLDAALLLDEADLHRAKGVLWWIFWQRYPVDLL